MGLHGIHAKVGASKRRPVDDLDITPAAIAIYRAMRRHERQQGGPGGDEWWEMNRKLADCFQLFAGSVVYEDPEWQSTRPSKSGLLRFDVLEAALKQANKKRTSKFKWER